MKRTLQFTKRITSIVLAMALAVSMIHVSEHKVQAATNVTTSEGLIFSIEDDNTAILKGTSNTFSATSVTIPATITHNDKTYPVQKIGGGAFLGKKIVSVVIENGIETIDYTAFSGCSKLSSITIPDSVTSIGENAFKSCTSLKTIEIPNGVKKFYGNVFSGCSNLTTVNIPKTVTSIGLGVFAGCVNLSNISVDSENANFSVENGVLYSKDKKTLYAYPTATGSYEIPSTVTTILGSAFKGASNLTKVTIPSSVTRIASYTFAECTKLETIEIPESVTIIDYDAFAHCDSLESISFPPSVTKIDSLAFYDCDKLTNLVIPSTVTTIGNNAFGECSSLQTIFYPADADYDIGKIGLAGVGCQFSYVENADNTVTLTVESVADGMTSISLPDDIEGMRIVDVEGLDGLDIDVLCTDHIFKEYYYLTSGHKTVCKKCGVVDDSEEEHIFDNENEACICGYAPFAASDMNTTLALTEGYQESNTLTVAVTPTLGSEILLYQWYENGVEISGATSANYLIPTGKTVGSYTYSCKVSCGGYTKIVNVCVAKVSEKVDDPVNPDNPADDTVNPDNPTDDPTNPDDGQDNIAPKKGDKIQDAKKLAWYKVTKAGTKAGKVGTVEYLKPISKKKKTVSIPSTIKVDGIKYKVTSIAKHAFKNNKYVTKVTIGKYVKTIGANAFYKCTKINALTIGQSVTTISSKAFYGCKKLKNITVKTKKLTAKKVGKNAFKGIHSKATIKVPKSKYKAYKTLLKKKGVGKKVKFKKI